MRAAYVNDVPGNIDKIFDKETQQRLSEQFEFYEGVVSSKDLSEKQDVECIFSTWGFPELTEKEMKEYFPNLKAIFYAAGSVKYFAEPYIKNGVTVCSAWKANAVPVAEFSLAQILLANKGYFQMLKRYRKNEEFLSAREYSYSLPGNYGVNVGILGLGAISSKLLELLKPYDLNLYVYSRHMTEQQEKELGVKKADLDFIFENCQVISNHMADVPATEGILNYALFSKMKPNGVFINTGRGRQVNETDLVRAMKEEPGRTALLDATTEEPCAKEHEFYTTENILLSPHIAGSQSWECSRMGRYMMEEAERWLAGEDLKYAVDDKILDLMA